MPFLRVSREEAGRKPMGFLKKYVDSSFNVIRVLVDKGKIKLNGEKLTLSRLLEAGDVIEIQDEKIGLREVKESRENPVNLKIPVVYEDSRIVVLKKPPFLAVQGGTGSKINVRNYLSFLKQRRGLQFLEAAHRLDKETSGVLVCAKSKEFIRELHEIFRRHEVRKKYVCLVKGGFKEKKGRIELPLRVNENEEVKVEVDEEGRRAVTRFYVKEEFSYGKYRFSLLEVEIETGVTHQIRRHLKEMGHPLAGDRMYGEKEINSLLGKVGLRRLFLHAREISFNLQGEDYRLRVRLPADLKDVIKNFKGGSG